MSANRRHGVDRGTAERLLRGAPAGRRSGADPLVALLAAAAGPVRPGELSGERVALAAFREARPAPVHQPRRGSMIKSVMAKALTAKVVLATATTGALGGGVVLAAASGNLPALPGSAGGGNGGSSASSHPSQPVGSHRPSDRPAPASSGHAGGDASPSPSVFGLCHAYTAGVAASHGKALDNPAFSVLIRNAGGRDNVAAYCATVLAAHPGNAPSAHPTGAPDGHGSPTSHPTGAPDEHGSPTSHPTGAPDEHGSPTMHPTRSTHSG
ncbi:MAG TPA: hypothetical protein VFX70_21480 [Mycobacteriales bacterium]|nr:hypothetical protein [Mycobacteriales bacterium]